MDELAWIERAKAGMLALLEHEHALVWPEIEAKLADRQNGPQPHILTKARQELAHEGKIEETIAPTRGGRRVAVWHRAGEAKRRPVLDAAGRKRLLYARFLSWNNAHPNLPNGLLGPAGESVLHQSLVEAAPHGYRLVNPRGGQVGRLLGNPVQGGPLDHAAFLTLLDGEQVPQPPVLVPFEVKNVRHWLYPNSAEIYQLLHKAALLQATNPDQAIVPVLICRRRSYFLWSMGRELGFFPVQVESQYVLPSSRIEFDHFNEVRNELGYQDLVLKEDAEPRLVKALTSALPQRAPELAARWAVCGPPLIDYFADLREYSDPATRAQQMEDFRDFVATLPGCDVGW